MGGSGSTRWKTYRRKPTVDNAFQITLSDWLKQKAVQPGRKTWGEWIVSVPDQPSRSLCLHFRAWPSFADYMVLELNTKHYSQQIRIVGLRMSASKKRWWFFCPSCEGKDAARLRAKLYMPLGAQVFACRSCHNLSYRSSQNKNVWGDEGDCPEYLIQRYRRLRQGLVSVFSETPAMPVEQPTGPLWQERDSGGGKDQSGLLSNRLRLVTYAYNLAWHMAISTGQEPPSLHEFFGFVGQAGPG